MRDTDIVMVDEEGGERRFVHLRDATTRLGFERSGDQRWYEWWQRGQGDFNVGTRYRAAMSMAMLADGHSPPTFRGEGEDAIPDPPGHVYEIGLDEDYGVLTRYTDAMAKAHQLYIERFYGDMRTATFAARTQR